MDRGERRRHTRAEQASVRASRAEAKKQDIARRKMELYQAFLDRHKLRMTPMEKFGVVLSLFVAATGGPFYWWLPDKLRHPFQREHNRRDRA